MVVRDLNMDVLDEVRDQWQFYRDRRPDQYGGLVDAVNADRDGVRHDGGQAARCCRRLAPCLPTCWWTAS